jgi:hypothetical protein
LRQLTVDCGMWIDVSVEDSDLMWANRNGGCHREPRPPRAFVPRQIDSRHIA